MTNEIKDSVLHRRKFVCCEPTPSINGSCLENFSFEQMLSYNGHGRKLLVGLVGKYTSVKHTVKMVSSILNCSLDVWTDVFVHLSWY